LALFLRPELAKKIRHVRTSMLLITILRLNLPRLKFMTSELMHNSCWQIVRHHRRARFRA
jgi:hypothetical protein